CRIQSNTHIKGTGVIFKKDGKNIYVLTAGHVVEDEGTYYVQFFGQTYPSRPMAVEVLNKIYQENTIDDLAVLKLDLKNWDEKYLVPPTIEIKENPGIKTVYTYGCPQGGWPTGYKGYLVDAPLNDIGATYFYPTPHKGRSGSGLFFEQNRRTYLQGTVILTNGAAVPTWKIREKLKEWKINE